MMRNGQSPLGRDDFETTARWIAGRQESGGILPWVPGGKFDPWDHVHAAMALTISGREDAARAAFRHLVDTQEANGGWVAEWHGDKIVDGTFQSNHAAYIATGLWHYQVATGDIDFVAEMWPTVRRAIDFVVDLQQPCGAIAWAVNPVGKPWTDPLVTGSSSIHGSLVCAIRMAERLDHDASEWRLARERLALVLCRNLERFEDVDFPNGGPGRHSMDWYYPVLGGAVRGPAGRLRLLDGDMTDAFLEEGVGCRCVIENPWYTMAETCEFVLALDAVGLKDRAREVLSWVEALRTEDGGYYTGVTHPDRILYPEGEQTPWTAATVLMASDALADETATASFFRDLAGEDLDDGRSRESAEVDDESISVPAVEANP
jgi:hypothetical protein